jgi:hypothetical protein
LPSGAERTIMPRIDWRDVRAETAYLASPLVCGLWVVLVTATVAATTAGTKNIPIDRSPASAAIVRQATAKINAGLGCRQIAATASDPVPAASSARYHHAGELPCLVTTAT